MRTALKGRTHGCTDQVLRREESPCQLGAVHTWHLSEVVNGQLTSAEWGEAEVPSTAC